MTVGGRLKGYVGERKQAEIAATWQERWSARKDATRRKPWTPDHVISSLSRCFNDQIDGVRFFFGDRARAVLLFDVLEVPEPEREDLLTAAELAMKTGAARAPQLIIDVTAWSGSRDQSDALFLAVEEQILKVCKSLRPIVLIMTEEQYRWLPRTIDDHGDDVRKERVKDADESRERVAILGEEHGLVLAPYPFSPFERWLAMSFDGRSLGFEPADGLAVFSERGELPRLPPVQHDLVSIASDVTPEAEPLPADPLQLRRLMVDLCLEDAAVRMGKSPAVRLGWARELGITVTSTEAERIEAEVQSLIRALGVEVAAHQPADLERTLARARRRPLDFTAMRVGDDVNMVNPPGDLPEDITNHPRVVVHRIEARLPALTRLLNELDQWTDDDLLDDPQLEQVILRLDPTGEERMALLHARAQVVLSETLRPRPGPPLEDWRGALGKLLAGEPPRATLLLRVEDWRGKDDKKDRPALSPRAHAWTGDHTLDLRLRCSRPGTEMILERDGAVKGVLLRKQSIGYQRSSVLIEPRPQHARDPDRWLDLLEASRGCGGNDAHVEDLTRKYGSDVHGDPCSWNETSLSLAGDGWAKADREVALTWLALRRTVRAETVRLHDDAVLAPLGGGIIAEMKLRRHQPRTGRVEPRASLLQLVGYNNEWRLSPLTDVVTSHRADTTSYYNASTRLGPKLPRGVRLEGAGMVADIIFRYSPLFASWVPEEPHLAMAASAVVSTVAAAYEDD